MAMKKCKSIQVFRPLSVVEISLLVQDGIHFENYMQCSPAAFLAMAPYQMCAKFAACNQMWTILIEICPIIRSRFVFICEALM